MTLKKYYEAKEKINEANIEVNELRAKLHDQGMLDEKDGLEYNKRVNACDELINALEDTMEQYEVCLSYSIGYRQYYGKAYKIGKTYLTLSGRKMNKTNGFRNIEEIEEITEQMRKEMIDDMLYY